MLETIEYAPIKGPEKGDTLTARDTMHFAVFPGVVLYPRYKFRTMVTPRSVL
jgi:hypothetical protein